MNFLKVELEKKEKKCFKRIKKCPTDKNLRDYEVKYEKIRSERQNAEMTSKSKSLKIKF